VLPVGDHGFAEDHVIPKKAAPADAIITHRDPVALLHIDRIGMGCGRDRPYFSGKHKCHGVNVQVIADPAGRLIWASPALPGARHDMGAAREHGERVERDHPNTAVRFAVRRDGGVQVDPPR
jgi:hypothetical protein